MSTGSAVVIAQSAAVALVLAFGCDGPGPRAASRPPSPPTDDASCPRLCEKLAACGGAPTRCATDCERDRAHFRAGIYGSFVACVDAELPVAECASLERDARAHVVATCFSATLEAYAARDGGLSLRRVVEAVCRRSGRCAASPAPSFDEAACVAELDSRDRSRGVDRLFAVAREELVAGLADCVEKRPCADDDPVAACSDALDAAPAAIEPAPSAKEPQ